ncbi:MAG TPA: epoxide hydrolase [Acidimicrobiales bacterium]|nr:epoxide hydrolase [Acidimicrobiales bacterium]
MADLPSGSDAVSPSPIAVPEADLDDLRDRLRRTRWPEAETVDDWSQGVPLAYVQELCRDWADRYDWRSVEARLNALGPSRTQIGGLGIHFLHVPSSEPGALPLVLTHGWPGSVVEFLDVIGPLTDPAAHGGDPADAFHVVCPSLPGYGFSDRPATTGWGVERIAAAWAELMARLGYDRYGAQGGDWGAMVSTAIGQHDPDHVVGVHVNMPFAGPAADAPPPTEAELAALAGYEEHRRSGTGYSKQQSTRPQTLGYGLVDSPAGQCAWIVEKFWAWTDCDGHPENALTRDQLLDNVMLYWLPATGASSARLYWESFVRPVLGPVEVPSGCSIFPKEIARLPRSWVERRFTDLRYWNELDRGGHFAAFEQPGLFVDEVRAFFRLVR